MADTAVRFGPNAGITTPEILYTAGTNGAIVRYIRVANTTNGDLTFSMSIGADASDTRICGDVTVPANSVYSDTVFIPLANTETLRWAAAPGLTVTGGVIAQ